VKHALEKFIGQRKDNKNLVFETTCGLRVQFPAGSEIDEDAPIDDRKGGAPWCAECHPDKVVARLKDEDGSTVALHPELGELEQEEGDGTTLAEDRGEEEVISEEVDER
jgi:hypothetical protein